MDEEKETNEELEAEVEQEEADKEELEEEVAGTFVESWMSRLFATLSYLLTVAPSSRRNARRNC